MVGSTGLGIVLLVGQFIELDWSWFVIQTFIVLLFVLSNKED